MKRPLAGLVVVYAAGIWFGSLADWPVLSLLWAIAGMSALFFLARRTRLALAPLLFIVLLAGMFGYRLDTGSLPANHLVRMVGAQAQNISLRGVVISETGDSGFKFDVTAVGHEPDWQTATGRLWVFAGSNAVPRELRYGDEIECTALLRVPPPASNPGTFDWQAWLARQKILRIATIRHADTCSVVAHDRGNPVTALSLRLRERFVRALQVGLETEPALAGILAGMVIGQRSEIPSETHADFQETGVFHVFAINGLHVGLVTGIVLVFLRLLRIPRRWCGLVAIPLLVLYVFATGAHPGAVRALVMASVWLFGGLLVRPVDALSSLAAAAFALLIWEPTQLFDGGFILSFTVVVAIVVMAPRIKTRLEVWTAPDPFMPAHLVPRWRAWLREPLGWLIALVSCSVAAWVGLLPLMAVYFHLFTPVSIVANLLVIPLLTGVIALGLAATAVCGWWPWMAVIFNNANFLLLNVMTRGVDWLGRLPGTHWFVQSPPVWLTVAYYAAGVLLLNRLKWVRRLGAALGVAVVGLLVVAMARPEEVVEVTALDLSDGAAVFVDLPGERNDWLIDGGTDWSGERVVLPFLRSRGVDRLGIVMLTCNDKAHAAGLMSILAKIPVVRVWENGVSSRSKYYKEWRATLDHRAVDRQTTRAGDEWLVGDRLKVRVLNPPRNASATRSDDNAVVLRMQYGATRWLMMSDAGATVENRLVTGGEDLRAAFIIKGRHGKEESCTAAFLDAVRPAAVIQVVNQRPSSRYLQPDVRDRLRERGIKFYRTDETGAVTVRLTKAGYLVQTYFPVELAESQTGNPLPDSPLE
jgi:competence protein ComEC